MPSHDLILNSNVDYNSAYSAEQAALLGPEGLANSLTIISGWPGYSHTPLRTLTGLAAETGVSSIFYKDESHRFNLKSFKPLGGAYAVARLLMEMLPVQVGCKVISIDDLLSGLYAKACQKITVTAATDGNHGRSVAWGAQMFGCKCVIFINAAVSYGREKAIAELGAEVRRNPGSFDAAVRVAQSTADENGWYVIADTSTGTDSQSPRHVTQGYAVMAAETISQLAGNEAPTHTFVQVGVGGLAAAVCSQFWQEFGPKRPKLITVEPYNAACCYESLHNGQPTAIKGNLDSLMGGLACGEMSSLAWDILKPGAHAAIKIAEEAAVEAMRRLACKNGQDPPIVAGESGVAGLAGFLAVARDTESRQRLDITESSRIVVFGTEGATDRDTYKEIVGLYPEEVYFEERN